jgi:uncharacterized protein
MKTKLLPFIVLLALKIPLAQGQNRVALDLTDSFVIYSENVKDTFQIQVSLPGNYNSTAHQYPVIFLLDSERMFGMAHNIVHWLKYSREIPDVIVVGIAYTKNWWQKRSRDYTPVKDRAKTWGEWPLAGGADNFILFMQKELAPALKRYRIDDTNKSIVGLSFGGLFVNYVLFSNPDMFDNYLIICPALMWDYHFLFGLDNQIITASNKSKKVFTAVGSLDDKVKIIEPWVKMNRLIAEEECPNLVWNQRMYDNYGHISVVPIALTDGLKFLLNE